ncbi:uncharacterized protein DUF4185 [Herbihabitans rhizosphaerae]|uniref:Uncharacterized protein DUF4185 n=1 Tax=Herbihabitans rhizosphaerae TaxID=1872711 RepID=A0A4Q7KVT6_9PSEU|nr:uncharacterized protein DUF4185 [Herbihabitans rhizosphaerae]
MVRVTGTTRLAQVTGDESINETGRRFGIVATDLGAMWDDDAGRVFVVFGDTFGTGWGGHGGGPAGRTGGATCSPCPRPPSWTAACCSTR